jgi:ATP-dependent DNA helicase RecG
VDFGYLSQLVRRGEGQTLEFKSTTGHLKDGCETLCGFLNSQGGTVLFGVNAEGRIAGQEVSDSTQQKVAYHLQKFEPVASVQIVTVPLPDDRRSVLVLTATPSSELVPYTYDGRAFERIGSTTLVMSQQKYQQLLLRRTQGQTRWEVLAEEGVHPEALDGEEILRTLRLGIQSGRLPESTGADVSDILNRLNLRQGDKILNAAVILFGNDVLPKYPQRLLRMARFRGHGKTEFIDNKQCHGHAFELLEEAMIFLRRHLPVAGRVKPGLFEREDEPLFPVEALREALVNAICHRDYTLPGGAISLAIFDDRLEIWSDGTLPFGITISDLKRDHPSRPRNPLIASVLYKRGLVESWGRGTQKIVELCTRAGHPEPEFEERSGAVGVRFLPAGYIAPHRVSYDLTGRQREILQLLSTGEAQPLRALVADLPFDAPEWAIRQDLYDLRRLGLISLRGHGRGAVWYLVRLPDEEG